MPDSPTPVADLDSLNKTLADIWYDNYVDVSVVRIMKVPKPYPGDYTWGFKIPKGNLYLFESGDIVQVINPLKSLGSYQRTDGVKHEGDTGMIVGLCICTGTKDHRWMVLFKDKMILPYPAGALWNRESIEKVNNLSTGPDPFDEVSYGGLTEKTALLSFAQFYNESVNPIKVKVINTEENRQSLIASGIPEVDVNRLLGNVFHTIGSIYPGGSVFIEDRPHVWTLSPPQYEICLGPDPEDPFDKVSYS